MAFSDIRLVPTKTVFTRDWELTKNTKYDAVTHRLFRFVNCLHHGLKLTPKSTVQLLSYCRVWLLSSKMVNAKLFDIPSYFLMVI